MIPAGFEPGITGVRGRRPLTRKALPCLPALVQVLPGIEPGTPDMGHSGVKGQGLFLFVYSTVDGGRGRIRTYEGVSRRIYSPLPLTNSATLPTLISSMIYYKSQEFYFCNID